LSSFILFELAVTQYLSSKFDLQNLSCQQSYLPDMVGVTNSTLDLLVDETRYFHSAHLHGSRGSVPQVSEVSTHLAWYMRVE
jgi:hypothetical protein